jgi:transcriptional regulator with XRE-family HTH domain
MKQLHSSLDSVPKRTRYLIDYFGFTDAAFSDAVGYSKVTMSKILNGKQPPGHGFYVAALEKFPRININWWMTGSGEPLAHHERSLINSELLLQEKSLLKKRIAILEDHINTLKQLNGLSPKSKNNNIN